METTGRQRAIRRRELRHETRATVEAARAARDAELARLRAARPACPVEASAARTSARASLAALRAEHAHARSAARDALREARQAAKLAGPTTRVGCRARVVELRAAERQARAVARLQIADARDRARRERAELRAEAERSRSRPKSLARLHAEERIEREIADFTFSHPHLEKWARRQVKAGLGRGKRRSIAEALQERYEAEADTIEGEYAREAMAEGEALLEASEREQAAAFERGELAPRDLPEPTPDDDDDFATWAARNPGRARPLTGAPGRAYPSTMPKKAAKKPNPAKPARRRSGVRTVVVNENPKRRRSRRRRNPAMLATALWGGLGGVAGLAVERLEGMIPLSPMLVAGINAGTGVLGAWGLGKVNPVLAAGFTGAMVSAGAGKVINVLWAPKATTATATPATPATKGLGCAGCSSATSGYECAACPTPTGRVEFAIEPGKRLMLAPGATGAVRVLVDRNAVGALQIADGAIDRQPQPARPTATPAGAVAAGMRLLGRRA